MTKPLDRTQRIFRALWLKAAASDEPLILNFKTTSQCLQMRLALYKFMKPRRNDANDPDLVAAGEKIAIAVAHEGKQVILKPKQELELAEMALLLADLEDDDLLDAADKSLMELSKLNSEPAAQQSSTPFYDRDS